MQEHPPASVTVVQERDRTETAADQPGLLSHTQPLDTRRTSIAWPPSQVASGTLERSAHGAAVGRMAAPRGQGAARVAAAGAQAHRDPGAGGRHGRVQRRRRREPGKALIATVILYSRHLHHQPCLTLPVPLQWRVGSGPWRRWYPEGRWEWAPLLSQGGGGQAREKCPTLHT